MGAATCIPLQGAPKRSAKHWRRLADAVTVLLSAVALYGYLRRHNMYAYRYRLARLPARNRTRPSAVPPRKGLP